MVSTKYSKIALPKPGRKIALNLILLPASSGKAAPDAIFYLLGGPGGAATTQAGASFMPRLRRDRDVVLVDQRGTGASNPLACNMYGDKPDMRAYFGAFPVEKLRACREQLEKVANLKLYTTSIAMDDLDDVRAAFGYERINLDGGSYGSTAALVYLRQHPDHVRTVTISGVAPPNAKIPLSFASRARSTRSIGCSTTAPPTAPATPPIEIARRFCDRAQAIRPGPVRRGGP